MAAEAANERVVITSRPTGMVTVENFAVEAADAPAAPTADAPLLVELEYVSVDPYMRGRLNDRKSYIPPFQLGQPGAGGVVARVLAVADGTEGFAPGDLVTGMLPWVRRQTVPTAGLTVVNEAVLGGAPASLFLGVLGITGLTALLPIEKFANAQPGQVAFVSGAAGAVGSVAGAIFKAKGLRVYGSAGSDEKCALACSEFGFDGMFNYKTAESCRAGLASVLEDGTGIDVYYDNVGGEMLDAVLERMNVGGSIILCGAISQYNATDATGIKNLAMAIGKSLSLNGFIVTNWIPEFPAAIGRLAAMLASGDITAKETVRNGFDAIPAAFCDLFVGGNVGKMVVKCKL